MDQAFLQKTGFTSLLLAMLVIGLLPFLAHSQTPAATTSQTTKASQANVPLKLGTFLGQYPATKLTSKLVVADPLWRLGKGAFAGYRAFKDKKAREIAYDDARASFAAECQAMGGHIEKNMQPRAITHHYQIAKGVLIDEAGLMICADAEDMPLGALVARSYPDPYYNTHRDSYVSLFILTKDAATEMMAIYHRGMARDLRAQAEQIEKQAANDVRIAAWRTRLSIGTETHCGPVLDVRGPAAQVAYGTQAGWVRIERLYPPQDAARCWEFSGL
jgi:hypothetical protein